MPNDSQRKASVGFDGLRVISLESRRATEMQRLIEKHGGQALVSPSMREAPVQDDRSTIDFAHRLIGGEIDAVILLTGVGFRMLVEKASRHVDRQRLLDALSDVPTLARGPKPVAVMRELGLQPTHRAPAPNTWREVLATIDASMPVANQTIAVQEYGESNPSLIAGLEARGAEVERVEVYQWALPEDSGPLEENAQRLAAGEADVVMLTSANQINNLLTIAEQSKTTDAVLEGIRSSAVVSIGPTTSERLRSIGLPVDIESSGAMGKMVADAATGAAEVLQRKQKLKKLIAGEPTSRAVGVSSVTPSDDSRRRLAGSERAEALRAAVAGQPWANSDFFESLPARAGRADPDLADASGGALHAGVSSGTRGEFVPRLMQEPTTLQ